MSGTSRGKWGSGVFKKVWPQPPLPPHLLFFFWNSPLQTLWVHVTVNNKIDKQTYNLLMEDSTAWYRLYQMYRIYFSLQWHCSKLHSTIQGKKIEFTTFSKKISSDEQNLTVNAWTTDGLSAYYDCEKFNENFDWNIYNQSHI